MPKNLLLEVGSDEIPARFMPSAILQLQNRTESFFRDSRLGYGEVSVFSTPRRLALFVTGLNETSDDKTTKVRGPSKRAAFDSEGNPTKALQGFSRSLGISPEAVTVENENGGEYVYGVKHEKGRPTRDILREIVPKIVMGMECPHPMRWGKEDWKWYRPIRWVVCLLGDEIVQVQLAGRVADRITFGHRTLHPDSAVIPHADQYFNVTKALGVEVDQDVRKQNILKDARILANSISGTPLVDEALLSEVVFLCEHPAGFLGEFDEKYLDLPKEILITAMQHHQRYFPILGERGQVLEGFVGIRDGHPETGISTVQMGNQWVLRARLEDAQFFYNQDVKLRLEARLPELKGVRFLKGAGTVYDKTARVTELTKLFGSELGLETGQLQKAALAASLLKCDLVTFVVREFPELEGIMGGIYGKLQQLPEEVTDAISQQYLPKGMTDVPPKAGISSIVALADKMDTLAVSFCANIGVSGSQDPFGLRRAGHGVVSILMTHGYDLDIVDLVQSAVKVASQTVQEASGQVQDRLVSFLMDRVETVLSHKGYSVQVIRAILGGREKRVARLPQMAHALAGFAGLPSLADVVTGWRRTSVLAKGVSAGPVLQELLEEPAEKSLYLVFTGRAQELDTRYEKGDYSGYLNLLAELRPAIDACLDEVLIMAPNPELKQNRLRLLGAVAERFTKFADFSQMLSVVP